MHKQPKTGLTRAGETLRKLAIAPSAGKLIDAAAKILDEPDAAETAYMARQLVQCTLPHSDPGDLPAWGRSNGSFSLGLRPGWDFAKGRSMGIPYGTIPRLLLFWVTTEAVRTKNRRLELGDTLSGFMRELGLDPRQGGKKSDAHRLREQMVRLFSASISFQKNSPSGSSGTAWLTMPVAPKAELWWSPRQPDQAALWGSWVELGEEFFTAITASPVPLDTRALRALKRSPLALDLYSLLTYRAFVANRKSAAQYLSWVDLERQLGTDYADTKDFRRKANAALQKIQTVLPGLRIARQIGGFVVLPDSLPAIPARPKRKPS